MNKSRSEDGRTNSAREEERERISLFTKQIARSVTRGQQVTLYIGAIRQITGYVAAHDEHSILLLIPDEHNLPLFTRKLVKRAHVTDYDLHDAATFQAEPARVDMEQILSSYRSSMFKVLGRRTPPGGNQ